MSAFQFRRAVRENVPLLVGLAGGTGSGKTYSAMVLAKGIAGDQPFAVIDTEAGRAKHYADEFTFDHGDLKPPFRPDAYLAAIQAADKAGYPVIVVDSMSHEWAGDGGCLDWQEEEFQRLGGRDAAKMSSWIAPKRSHKSMMSKLLQLRAHLILCFRAEPKVDMVKNPRTGKTEVVDKRGPGGFEGWLPICEKNLPYELTTSFLLMADLPGVPKPIKLEAQHRPFFPAGKVITAEAGRKLAEWARGGSTQTPPSGSGDAAGEARPTGNSQGSGHADGQGSPRAAISPAPTETPAWEAAEAPLEPPASTMRDESPGAYAWTSADLRPRLDRAGLSMSDLRLALGVPAVTKANFEDLINCYLEGAPGRTLDTLISDTQAAISAASETPALPLEAATT